MSIAGSYHLMYKCSGFHESVRCAKVFMAKWIKVGVARPDKAKERP